jgi:hypothetical protein
MATPASTREIWPSNAMSVQREVTSGTMLYILPAVHQSIEQVKMNLCRRAGLKLSLLGLMRSLL